MVAPSPAPPYVGGTPKRLPNIARRCSTSNPHRLGRRRPEKTIAASHVWMAPAVQEVTWRAGRLQSCVRAVAAVRGTSAPEEFRLSPVSAGRHKATAGGGPGCIAALGGNPFDQAWIIIPDVSDPRAHGPAGHLVRWKRREQGLERGRVRSFFPKPDRPSFGLEDRRHPVVELSAEFVRFGRDDGEASNPFARRRAPVLPQASQCHQASVRQRNRVGLLAGPGFFPFVEAIDRHEAAAALECVAEGRPGLKSLPPWRICWRSRRSDPWPSREQGPSAAGPDRALRLSCRDGPREAGPSEPHSSSAGNLKSGDAAGSRTQA